MSFGSSPDVIDPDGHGGWTSGADQSLLFQTMSDAATHVGLHAGPDAFGFFSAASDTFAWTSQLAEQSLQPDFDPNLVILFDKQAQGTRGAGAPVVRRGARGVDQRLVGRRRSRRSLSSPFGFADFLSGDGAVRVARPVAVAETADGAATTRPPSCGCARTARTTCRSPSTGSTISTARSTACIRAMPAIRRRCRAGPIR